MWLAALPATALQEAVGHVELDPVFNVANGSWQWRTYWYDDDLNPRTDPVDTLCFPGPDSAPAEYGVRNTRPADPNWDFLGMAPEEPVWIFSSGSYSSVGFAATQTELSGNLAITLHSVTGPAGGVFSMFSGSAPVIQMQTIDGISGADVFQKPENHSHVNWAFSRKGLWIVRLKAQGLLASSGAATPVSQPASLVFAIGDQARWKAANFNLAELSATEISGDAADPDGDGWNNLMEYALGGDPKSSSILRAEDGQPLAPRLLAPVASGLPWRLSYYRKVVADEAALEYEVESSPTLNAASWTTETGVEQVLSSSGAWEQVGIPLAGPQAGCFFRLKISTP